MLILVKKENRELMLWRQKIKINTFRWLIFLSQYLRLGLHSYLQKKLLEKISNAFCFLDFLLHKTSFSALFSSKKTCSLSSIAKDSREFTADFGRVTQKICGNFWKFLPLSKASIRTRVLGKSVSRGAGYGLEIHVCSIFQGHVKGIAWVKKKIEDADIMVQFCIEKCMENAL